MRIAFFTNTYLPNIFGSTTSIETFRIGLESLGHEVFVFTPKFGDYIDENPRVFRYPAFLWKHKITYPIAISWYPPLTVVIKNLNFDVIHSHQPFSVAKDGLRQAKRNKVPMVFTNHTRYDDYTHYVPLIPQAFLKKHVIRQATKFANQCQQVITPTQEIKDLISHYGVKTPIEVLPTGIDWQQFQIGKKEEVRKKYGIKKDEICLLWLGRLEKEKNLDFLVKAASEIMKQNLQVKLMLAGEGSEKSRLREFFHQQNLGQRVIFTGLVAKSELADYYAAADMFIQASLSETQGLTTNEAQAAGLPVVAVEATGARDLIEDGITGILVQNDQQQFVAAIQSLLNSLEQRQKIGQQAKEVARDLDYINQAKKLVNIYQQLLGH